MLTSKTNLPILIVLLHQLFAGYTLLFKRTYSMYRMRTNSSNLKMNISNYRKKYET